MLLKRFSRELLLTGAAMWCFAPGSVRAADNGFEGLLISGANESYSLLTTITIPGKPLTAFDISAVDPVLPYYYFSDRSNAALDIIDVRSNEVVGQVGGFVGIATDPVTGAANNGLSGPDGVAITGVGEVWVGDGDSSVKVVDVNTQKVVQTISTTRDGQSAATDERADEMAYDPKDQILVVANNAASPPYITLISTVPADRHVLGQIVYDTAAGVEASAYDPASGLFYINLTQFGTDVNSGAVSIVDPRSLLEFGRFPVEDCNGAGISLGPKQHLLVGCSLTNNSQIFDARNGTLLATIPQVSGSDETYYNPGDKKFYLAARDNPSAAGGPVLSVIDAVTNKFVVNIPTDISAHSVAADPRTNHIFVPLGASTSTNTDVICPGGCVAVYAGKIQKSPVQREVESLISDLEKQ